MPEAHRRRMDANGDTVHERATDNDFWAKTALALEHYKILWILVIAVAGYTANNFIAPLKQVPVLQAQLLAVKAQQDTSKVERRELQQAVRILVRIECFTVSERDRAKYDIDCTNIPLPEVPLSKP